MTKCDYSSDRPDPTAELSAELRAAFKRLSPLEVPPPNLTEQLARVYQAVPTKENLMTSLYRMFTGQRWYLKAALAAFILTTITALAFIVPSLDNLKDGTGSQAAWAAENGYQLVYDFGPLAASATPEGPSLEVQETLKGLQQALQGWVAEQKANRAAGAPQQELIINVNANDDGVVAMVGLPGAELTTFESLRDAVALADPGLPLPTVTEMTWFYDLSDGIDQHGLVISFAEHQFAFPAGATEEEMETEIKDWFAAQGREMEVDITVTTTTRADGEETRVEVRVTGDEPK